MLALAGYPLGLDFLFLDPAQDPPAGQLAPVLHGAFTDRTLLKQLARRCDVLTFDWENVSTSQRRASCLRSVRSVNAPCSTGASWPAGGSCAGSRNRKSRPSG